MAIDESLVGTEGSASVAVTADTTAHAYGNPGVHVFATPALVALFERAAINAIGPRLEPGQSSVGSVVRVTHRAPTPLGGTVTATARVRSINGREVWFDLAASDDQEPVGDGEHLRILIDDERFTARVERKRATLAGDQGGPR